jgi:Ca2+:H+ antiporter
VLLNRRLRAGLLFSLKTHPEVFGGWRQAETGEAPWPLNLALVTLAGVTILVALVSELFVAPAQKAAVAFAMTPGFIGFIVVALAGGAAEMASAFFYRGATQHRRASDNCWVAALRPNLDLRMSIALGSASQIALFVAPIVVLFSCLVGRVPMDLNSGWARW